MGAMSARPDDPAPLDIDVEHEFEPAPATLRIESLAALRKTVERLAALTRLPDLGAERAEARR
jgi:hypothetical protein